LAISLICRFYPGYTVEAVGRLTLKEFDGLNSNMAKIVAIENPGEKEDKALPMTSGALMSQGMIKGKIKKRKRI
jgi:hypothetical protein